MLDANGQNGKEPNGAGDGEAPKEEEPSNAKSQTWFVIAFIGSVDDLTLFVPMLVGKSFDIVQLMLGASCAAVTIVTICLFIGLCKPVADLISKIPLAFIVLAFAVMLLIKGFMEPDQAA